MSLNSLYLRRVSINSSTVSEHIVFKAYDRISLGSATDNISLLPTISLISNITFFFFSSPQVYSKKHENTKKHVSFSMDTY